MHQNGAPENRPCGNPRDYIISCGWKALQAEFSLEAARLELDILCCGAARYRKWRSLYCTAFIPCTYWTHGIYCTDTLSFPSNPAPLFSPPYNLQLLISPITPIPFSSSCNFQPLGLLWYYRPPSIFITIQKVRGDKEERRGREWKLEGEEGSWKL